MNNNRLEEKRNGGKKKELLYYIKNQAIRVIGIGHQLRLCLSIHYVLKWSLIMVR